ncbi:MAG: ABC-2 family transporter protein [Candidatus Omnitrophica bacterium]|nr:ABC-2 family transporter protein [Candidatus Omnitrophota bacterium]
MKGLNKYFGVIYNTIAESSEFRINHIFSFLTIALPLIFMIFLWKKVYTDINVIQNFSLSSIITYYFLVILIQDITYPGVNFEIVEDIKEGRLSIILTKPISYPIYIFSIKIGVSLPYFLISLMILSIFLFIIKENLVLPVDLCMGFIFLLVFFLSFVLGFLLSFILSIFSFWIEEGGGLEKLTDVLIPILSGLILPLSFFPSFIHPFFKILPFKYTLNFPVEVFLGILPFQKILEGIIFQIAWIFISLLVSCLLWKRGLKHYKAIGG